MPVRGVPGWRRGSVELGCAEGAVERVTVRSAQGLGASADRVLSPELGSAKMGDLRRALCGGWKTWSLPPHQRN